MRACVRACVRSGARVDIGAHVRCGNMQDLMKRFKRNLKTESAKTAFKELLRRYARVENGKMCLK